MNKSSENSDAVMAMLERLEKQRLPGLRTSLTATKSRSNLNWRKTLFVVCIAVTGTAAAAGELPTEVAQITTEDGDLSSGSIEIYREGRIEWRQRYKGGICGVFNPASNQVEWRDRYKGGIAGVFNPVTKTIEWRQRYNNGVAGVFNPETKQVEWKNNYKGGIAAAFNPITSEITWKHTYKGDVSGVFNPATAKIEWREKYKHGVAGVFNPSTQKVEWKERYRYGMAGIIPGQPDSLYCSSFTNEYDDDDK